jgi:hypothetical protein
MSKFDVTGQVAGIGYTDAEKAKASGAVTDAGYLGGTSWIKTQYDAAREFYKNGSSQLEKLEFADAVEGLAIPDGEFDFFDKTFNLTNKGVTDLLVGFKYKLNPSTVGFSGSTLPRDTDTHLDLPLFLNAATFGSDGNGGVTENVIGGSKNGGNLAGTTFLVTNDYTECGVYGTSEVLGFSAAWGTNPPPTDTGGMSSSDKYHQPGDIVSGGVAFWQYGDSTDSKAGFRYMIGLYNGTSALSSEASQDYVVKSMSINTTAAGVNQLVLHFRKTAVLKLIYNIDIILKLN